MKTKELTRPVERLPFLFDDFFRPWNEWFGGEKEFLGRMMTIPAVNIKETKDDYMVMLAVPGMKKDDFNIDLEGNLLMISCEKEEKLDEKENFFNRKEYSYFNFKRSFTLPEEVKMELIQAKYEDGVLKLILPKKEESKKMLLKKHIEIK
jgi:HSP20 family protein